VEFETKAMNHVESPANQQRGTVLIVDDDMDALRLTQRVIANLCPNLGLRCARSGRELLDYL
jgi:hypothetical protein